ncbi:MAG: helix-turn-helix domain-containing protein [Roseburia sp.]|nr:helix-turn-helix domain-containing protein [Roseburia sp.]MCM1557737.1 helix-turn-helix domain-containing protein [Anaeroplasma bactoclasticum]
MFFKENLAYLMNKLNLSAPTLSKLSGVPKTTINSIKSPSSKNPTVDTAYKLAAALNVSLDDMVSKNLSGSDN